jgi:RNA polymerase sigma factor (sigma-70 family)
VESRIDTYECDRALVEDVLAGNSIAFSALVEQHQRLVWHLVYRMVQHPEDCRELCQEVFIRVYRNLRQFRHESSLSSWIGRIAYNICVRHLQRRRLPLAESVEFDVSPVETVADEFDLAAACANEQLVVQMHAALEALPPVSRTVLTLFYLEEIGVSEVAAIMDKPVGTVKNLLFRARNLLRLQLKECLEIFNERQ